MISLVTGGHRGIGLGIATALSREGYQLVITGRSDPSKACDALKILRQNGVDAEYVQADVSKAADRKRLVETVAKRFGRLDVLVNNAGIAPRVRADILEASEESFDELMSINLKGPYFLTQLVAGWMIRQKQADNSYRGCIINVSSCSATVASVNRGDYCISKAGIAMATKLWVVRLAEFGIDVYEIRPGIIQTDMTKVVQEKYNALIQGNLLLEKRWGTPSDIGKAAAMLARGDLPYASGSVLSLDGGLTVDRL
ncbi:MAG: 3-ketoacyl-ACP reductase [Candidatus Korobacteraceae bacterium]|jgi:NAD(P)-dependent dehydrogenase (short-subunit alcohol dehydrogenase family)